MTILGKRFAWRLARLRKHNGYVTGSGPEQPASSGDIKHREIVIDATLKGEAELRYMLHEMLHAADWHKSEEWVDQVSADLARVLWRLGYRKESK